MSGQLCSQYLLCNARHWTTHALEVLDGDGSEAEDVWGCLGSICDLVSQHAASRPPSRWIALLACQLGFWVMPWGDHEPQSTCIPSLKEV